MTIPIPMRLRFKWILLILLNAATAWLYPNHAWAQTDSGPTMAPLPTADLLQAVVGLCTILAFIAVAAWLLRRVTGVSGVCGGTLKVIDGLSLGARERLVLVQVGNRQLLLGIAPGRVQTLHVLDQSLALDRAPGCESSGFSRALRTVLAQRQKSSASR